MSAELAEQMFRDVEQHVVKGNTINISKADSLNAAKRLALRSKRKMFVKAASLAATAAIGGPVGLGIAVATIAVVALGTVAYNYAMIRRAKSKIAEFMEQYHDGPWQEVNDELCVNPEYRKILYHVKRVCEDEGVVDIFNAFSELERDFTTQQSLRERPITDCKDAITLWESYCRVHYRMEGLREKFKMFDGLIQYVVAQTSLMDGQFLEAFPVVWRDFKRKAPRDRMGILNAAANHGDVRHTRFWQSDVDHSAWIRKVLPAGTLQTGIPETPSQSTVSTPTRTVSASTEVAVSTATTTATFGSQLTQTALTSSVSFTPSANVIQSAVEGTVGVGVEMLNNHVNRVKYETRRTGVWIFERSQTERERVNTLRTFVNDHMKQFVTKFDHLITSHGEFMALKNGSADAATIARKLLRRQKHVEQMMEHQRFVFEFHELVVSDANKMDETTEKEGKAARTTLKTWLTNHGNSNVICGEGGEHCYLSVPSALQGLRISGSLFQNASQWENVPCCPVKTGDSPLEVVLNRLTPRS